MIEYIANRNIDGKEESVRFIGKGSFIVLKNNQIVCIPDNFDKDPESIFGDSFEKISEYITFYDSENDIFRLVELGSEVPSHYSSIPYEGGKIGSWMVGRLEKKGVYEND